jgi:hypothetical protein
MKKETQFEKKFVPLSPTKVKKIAAILEEAWSVPPAIKAAKTLVKEGFTADDLWKFGKTKKSKFQPEQWHDNTFNEMRDIESLSKLRKDNH